MTSFNFDEWVNLAKTDKDEFERRRLEYIENVILAAPKERQHQLRCFQWRIDMERNKCNTPMQACVHIFNKMWKAVYGKDGLLETMSMLNKKKSPVFTVIKKINSEPQKETPGKVLPFKRTDDNS